MNENLPGAEAPYARHLSRLIRPFPDFDFFFIKPLRQKAVDWLQLPPGARVLDMGCGTGGSFPCLTQAVGATGEVVGVDISPQSCVNARRRIAKNGWRNVDVVESAAQSVNLNGTFDGVLMFAAPDVFASEAALENIFPHLRENARVVFFGAKISGGRLGRLLNPVLRKAVTHLSPGTPLPDEAPWTLLAKRVQGLRVEEYFYGSMFLASGCVVARK
jgi:demethylmenaquinone methyltransferase/2-methoxy-6-polyprenyl-1,4-benzoquinol methylase